MSRRNGWNRKFDKPVFDRRRDLWYTYYRTIRWDAFLSEGVTNGTTRKNGRYRCPQLHDCRINATTALQRRVRPATKSGQFDPQAKQKEGNRQDHQEEIGDSGVHIVEQRRQMEAEYADETR
ncbi:MAG: hypothetical protein GXP25_23975 [Planctomycetes bacterium]|nr:hypothetical protein [Planctomycetota bacterium]